MKDYSSATLSSIYKINVKALINAKFKLTDIQAPTFGGLLPYPRFRGTLAKLIGIHTKFKNY